MAPPYGVVRQPYATVRRAGNDGPQSEGQACISKTVPGPAGALPALQSRGLALTNQGSAASQISQSTLACWRLSRPTGASSGRTALSCHQPM